MILEICTSRQNLLSLAMFTPSTAAAKPEAKSQHKASPAVAKPLTACRMHLGTVVLKQGARRCNSHLAMYRCVFLALDVFTSSLKAFSAFVQVCGLYCLAHFPP